MPLDFASDEDLLVRLSLRPHEQVYLVGSAVTAPSRPGEPGVPRVDDVIDLIRAEYRRASELERLEAALAAEPDNRYQAAFRFLLRTRDQEVANSVIRRAVLLSRRPSPAFPVPPPENHDPEILRALEGDVEGWHLPPATEALGRVIARLPAAARPIVLTSNFDPLIAVSVRRAGGRAYTTALQADGSLARVDSQGCLIVHVHGDWFRTDSLHSPAQLGQDRPKLTASLAHLVGARTLVVLGYSGWDDVFTRSLISAIRNGLAPIEVAWTFYPADEAAIVRDSAHLLEMLRPGVEFGRVALYKGIDAHTFLPRLAARLVGSPAGEPAYALSQRQAQIQQTVAVVAASEDDTGFLGVPLKSVSSITRSAPIEQVYLNVWFPKFEPRAPRFVVDVPIEMHVALGPQRHGAPADPLSEDLLGRLRRLAQIDVWVQCADADVTPCDGTLQLPWPTNVLSFELTPRRPGGLRIVVVLLIHNQPVHRLEREVQVHDRRERGER